MSFKRKFVAALPDRVYRPLKFWRTHGRLPRRPPQNLSEKVNWRILNDRRRLLSWTGDKLAMKDRASQCQGLRLPRTVWTGANLHELVGVPLPAHWALKPNGSTGAVHRGWGHVTTADADALVAVTDGWLDAADVTHRREWIYGQARRTFIVEEWIGSGEAPTDFRFFVFAGQPRLIQVDVGRFTDHRRGLYDTNWTPLPVRYGTKFPPAPPIPRPERLDEMLRIASELGREFDFIRIDLYEVDGEVWFGEFSPYPASGLAVIEPRSYDELWGSWWELPARVAD